VSYSYVWMKVTRPKNADYDGLKKILTILRKNVFSYVDHKLRKREDWTVRRFFLSRLIDHMMTKYITVI
jgi:hypothetical protein